MKKKVIVLVLLLLFTCSCGKETVKLENYITLYGLEKSDIPSSNSLWGSYLKENGFQAKIMPDSCPDCYTIKQFAFDHPKGIYVVATGSHVVAVVNGDYYDSWDSGDEIVAYYFEKENTDELSNV